MSPFASLFKTKREREKEQQMLKYGARLLQEIIAACDGNNYYPIKIFSASDIRKAMDRAYHHIDGEKHYWRATYEDRQIFIKPHAKYGAFGEVNFFNEISTVVQLNHTNVVKLLGCCFEMENDLVLIFELVPNNLYDLLHKANSHGPIAWENRLRIAIEIADAVTYLHIAKPSPIIHRDITSKTILLDEHYRPKLCGFSLSLAIPLGETHVEFDKFYCTFGYVAPEYAQFLPITEKIDVYSFGMLLLELLSGKRPNELFLELFETVEEPTGQELEIQVLEKAKSLMLIFDANLPIDKRKLEQLMACVELAGRCIDHVPDQRPAMKEVALQLRQIERHQISTSNM